jgi:NAD(P)-dependent dehydrogenase (short-subunit alcohol dehydrogenase family)
MNDASNPSIAGLSDLSGKVAFVTGSANGIGLACAHRMAQAGARVCGFDLDPAGAATLRDAVGDPDRVLSFEGDVRRRADVEQAVQAVVTTWGRIDAVVNSAGLFPPSPLAEITDELWNTVIETNASGTFIVSQVCAKAIGATSGSGAIVNIASKSALQPSLGFAHYAASKGAVAMITKAMALELAPMQIRVNAVAPGSVATETAAKIGAQAAGNAGAAVTRSSRCPMGRSATPDEIARVVLFLASEWSTYMTGSIVLADGGFLVS